MPKTVSNNNLKFPLHVDIRWLIDWLDRVFCSHVTAVHVDVLWIIHVYVLLNSNFNKWLLKLLSEFLF